MISKHFSRPTPGMLLLDLVLQQDGAVSWKISEALAIVADREASIARTASDALSSLGLAEVADAPERVNYFWSQCLAAFEQANWQALLLDIAEKLESGLMWEEMYVPF